MLRTSRLGQAGLWALAALLFLAIAGSWLAPYDPYAQVTAPFASPSFAHWLGADDLGQDLFSQLLVGARTSLMVGVLAAVVATVVGTAVGLAAGVARGITDMTLMRLVDVMLTLPFIPLVIVLSAFAGPGFSSTIFVIGLVMWARTARVLRSQVLSARERGPAVAARAMGAGVPHIMWHHVLPSVFPLVVPELVRAANAAILLESSLAFLGLGDPTRLSWGSMLYHANVRSAFLTDAWLWWELPPGLCIGGTVLAFVLVGYAIEGRLRPRLSTDWRVDTTRPTSRSTTEIPRTAEDIRSGALLAIDALHVEYRSAANVIQALAGVSLEVSRGEIVGIVGESGSGKSTLVAASLGLLPASAVVTAGSVSVNGSDIRALNNDAMRHLRGKTVVLVPQSAMNSLNPVRTIGSQLAETVRLHSSVDRKAARLRARELLALVDIPADRVEAYPHEFSGGMRQRVVIAMAIANDPQVIIADEPTTGLDVLLQTELLTLLNDLRNRLGIAVVLVSHDLAAVARIADRVLVMHRGRVVESGETGRLLNAPAHEYSRRLVRAIPELRTRLGTSSRERITSRVKAEEGNRQVARHTTNSEPVLRLAGVSKSYGASSVRVLDNVSLQVHRGERVGLIGGSGAGKSTIARMIVGLSDPDTGDIYVDGIAVSLRSTCARRTAAQRVHLVFQDPYESLAPGMRVRDLVAEPCRIHGVAKQSQIENDVISALEDVGLVPASRFLDTWPHELSGGERQRVAIARAIILKPALIVADEPTSQLDAPLRADIVMLMHTIGVKRGTAYLYITHDIAIASVFCDRLVVLQAGRVVETGLTAEIVRAPAHPYTALLLAAARGGIETGSG